MNTVARKITRAQVRTIVLQYVREQEGICPLCLQPLDPKQVGSIVLDHDHETGYVRAALHRSCNSGEGKARLAIGKWIAGKVDNKLILEVLERLVMYYKEHTGKKGKYIYYDHKTEEEEKRLRLARDRKRRAERRAARQVKRSSD